jgi:uncharacterized membrane protein
VKWFRIHVLIERADTNRTKAIYLLDDRAVSVSMISRMLRHTRCVENASSATVTLNLIYLARREASIHQHRPRVEAGRG